MTAFLHFEEKVHRKDLAQAEVIPLLMPRLLCHVLEHLGFPVPPPTAPAPPETTGPSSTTQQPSQHIPVTSRDLSAIMDVVCALATTTASLAASQTALAERMARAEVTLAQNQAILLQIQSHLGLPPVTVTEPIQPTTHDQSAVSASAAAIAFDPPVSTPPAE